MNSFVNTLDLYFGRKAPQLPVGLKSFLVKIAPYLTILSLLFAIPAVLALFGLSFAFGTAAGYAAGFSILGVLSIVVIILNAMALPGLFRRTPQGWNFVFYSVLVQAIQSLLMMNIVGLVIGLLIGFYILFQVRSYYFGGSSLPHPDAPSPVHQ